MQLSIFAKKEQRIYDAIKNLVTASLTWKIQKEKKKRIPGLIMIHSV